VATIAWRMKLKLNFEFSKILLFLFIQLKYLISRSESSEGKPKAIILISNQINAIIRVCLRFVFLEH